MYKGPLTHSLLCSEFVELTLNRAEIRLDFRRLPCASLNGLRRGGVNILSQKQGLVHSLFWRKKWAEIAVGTWRNVRKNQGLTR